jgi:hypothetical protein
VEEFKPDVGVGCGKSCSSPAAIKEFRDSGIQGFRDSGI